MSREIVTQDAVTTRFEEHGWLSRACVYAGRRSSPDRWFVRKGLWVLVEFKKRGEKPDGLQLREHQKLRDHGARVFVIDNIDDGYTLVEKMTALSDANVH